METKVLEEIGFSKGEIKVYFALIEIGESTIGPLSKTAKVTPAKVYQIIDKLIKKGLATQIIKSRTKYFDAVNPKQILTYLDEKNKEINEQKKEIKELLPLIESKKKLQEGVQSAHVYQTFQGMRTLYNEAIETLKKNKEDFIGFTLGEEEYKYKESEYFFQEYDLKRKSEKIKTRLLGHESQRKYIESKNYNNLVLRYLPYKMPTGVIIFGNKVATIVWGEVPTAFVIKSKKAAEAYKKFFEDMWKIAKK